MVCVFKHSISVTSYATWEYGVVFSDEDHAHDLTAITSDVNWIGVYIVGLLQELRKGNNRYLRTATKSCMIWVDARPLKKKRQCLPLSDDHPWNTQNVSKAAQEVS